MDESDYYTLVQLRQRGWTDTMIHSLLGLEDERWPVNHWANFAGKKMYERRRVEAHEATEHFRRMYRRARLCCGVRAGDNDANVLRSVELERLGANLFLLRTPTVQEAALQKIADTLSGARRRGYRTPHKC